MEMLAAIFAAFSKTDGFGRFAQIAMGRTDNIDVRFGAAVALMFNVLMVAVAFASIVITIPKPSPSPRA